MSLEQEENPMANKSYAIAASLIRIFSLAAQLAADPSSTGIESMPTAWIRQPTPMDARICGACLTHKPAGEVPHRLQVSCCEKRAPAPARMGLAAARAEQSSGAGVRKIFSVSLEN
jgi:hypothetical protein